MFAICPETSASNLQTNVILIAWCMGNVWKQSFLSRDCLAWHPTSTFFFRALENIRFVSNFKSWHCVLDCFEQACTSGMALLLECWYLLNICVSRSPCVCVCVFIQTVSVCMGPDEVVIPRQKTCLLHYQWDTFYFLNLTLRLSSVIYEITLCVCLCVCLSICIHCVYSLHWK